MSPCRILFALILSSFVTTSAEAVICRGTIVGLAQPHQSGLALRMGDVFHAHFNGQPTPDPVHFLGASRELNGNIGGYFFFDPAQMEIHYIPKVEMELTLASAPVDPGKVEPIVRSINQEGGTCAAYAIFNNIHQLLALGSIGNGLVVRRFESEAARNKTYVWIDQKYYGDGDHRGAENEVAAELGYEISRLDSSSPQALAASIRHSSGMGWPMLLYFSVDAKMSQTPYTIFHHGTKETASRRLWLPRRDYVRKGGHQINVFRSFVDLEGREWLVVVDSNWQAPRLWPIQELNYVDVADIGGWTLWQRGPNPTQLPPPLDTPFITGEGVDEGGVDPSYPVNF